MELDIEFVRDQIHKVRSLSEQYGQLAAGETLPFPVIAAIIAYYENDGENEAVTAAEDKVKLLHAKLSKAQGSAGGLQKRINKLEKELLQMENVKKNSVKLARISNFAYSLVEFCDKEANKQIDVNGESLNDNPLYARLRAELDVTDEE